MPGEAKNGISRSHFFFFSFCHLFAKTQTFESFGIFFILFDYLSIFLKSLTSMTEQCDQSCLIYISLKIVTSDFDGLVIFIWKLADLMIFIIILLPLWKFLNAKSIMYRYSHSVLLRYVIETNMYKNLDNNPLMHYP